MAVKILQPKLTCCLIFLTYLLLELCPTESQLDHEQDLPGNSSTSIIYGSVDGMYDEVTKVLRVRSKRGIQDVLKLEKSIELRGIELESIEANRTRKLNETRRRSSRRGGRFCLIKVN